MSQDLISVIIPVYKAAEYIAKRGFTVLNQTYPNIEFIFVEDCSQDNTWQKLQELKATHPDKNIIIYKNEKNLGPGPTRNQGLELASGKYVYFADADDEPDSSLLQKAYDKLEEDQSDFVLFAHNHIKADNKETHLLGSKLLNNSEALGYLKKDPLYCFVVPWNKVVRKSFLDRNKIKFPPILYGDDFCWSMQLIFLSQKASFINEPLYNYIDTNGSLSSGKHALCIIDCFNFNKNLIQSIGCKNHILIKFLINLIETYKQYFSNINEDKRHQLACALFDLPDIKNIENQLISHYSYNLPIYKLVPKIAKTTRERLKLQYLLFKAFKQISHTKCYTQH